MLNESEYRIRFGEKLKTLRKQRGLTQGEFAEILNYSDKAVSKWERGESVPDAYTVYVIADFFGVTMDDLFSDNKEINAGKASLDENFYRQKSVKIFVPFITAVSMLFVASIGFLVMKSVPSWESSAYFTYIFVLPIISLVLTILSAIWWNGAGVCACVSSLIWTTGITLYTSIPADSMKYLFICCVILQVVCVLVYLFTYFFRKKPGKK